MEWHFSTLTLEPILAHLFWNTHCPFFSSLLRWEGGQQEEHSHWCVKILTASSLCQARGQILRLKKKKNNEKHQTWAIDELAVYWGRLTKAYLHELFRAVVHTMGIKLIFVYLLLTSFPISWERALSTSCLLYTLIPLQVWLNVVVCIKEYIISQTFVTTGITRGKYKIWTPSVESCMV